MACPKIASSLAAALLAFAAAARPARAGSDFEFFESEAKVITASRRLQPLREAPANVVVITREKLRASGARTLADALALLPGVYIPRHRKGGLQLWIRGGADTYNDKTLLLVDGFPFKELVYGQHPIDEQFPLADVKRIELVKGPGSVLYGANAFTGVVNVITLEPGDVEGVEASAGVGSWNTQSRDFLVSRSGARGGAIVSGAYFKSDGDRHGADENGAPTSRRDPEKLLSSSVKLANDEWTLAVRYSEHQTGYVSLPDVKTETVVNKTTLVQAAWKRPIGSELTLSARAFYNHFDWPREREELKAGTFTLSKIKKTQEKTQMSGGGVQADWSPLPDDVLTAGVDFQNERGLDIRRTEFSMAAANPAEKLVRWSDPARPDENDWGVFAENTWSPSSWARLTLGLRRDQHDRFGGQTSPRAAMVLELTDDLTAKLLYGRAYRAPSFRELFVIETSHDSDGDPGLRPERIETRELDLSYVPVPGLTAGLALYHTAIRDYISVDAGRGRYANLGSYYVDGAESSLSWSWRGHALFANHTLLRARDGFGDDAPNLAKEIFNAGVDVRAAGHLDVHTAWNRVGRRTRPSNYQAAVAPSLRTDRLGGYDRVDVALTTRGLPAEVSLTIHNVLGTRSFNPDYIDGGFDQEHPGRQATLRVRVRF